MLSKEDLKEMMNETERPEFTKREQAYRRGFCHGVCAARRSDITIKEAYDWRHGKDETAPPHSAYAGTKLHGLTEVEPHQFFMEKPKPIN